MTDKFCVSIIHDCIKQKNNWYIGFTAPEACVFQNLIEKAKEEADNAISCLSKPALYSRYRVWRASSPFIGKDEHYFHAFLNDLVWNLGKKALKKEEFNFYEDSCSLSFHFINSKN